MMTFALICDVQSGHGVRLGQNTTIVSMLHISDLLTSSPVLQAGPSVPVLPLGSIMQKEKTLLVTQPLTSLEVLLLLAVNKKK